MIQNIIEVLRYFVLHVVTLNFELAMTLMSTFNVRPVNGI